MNKLKITMCATAMMIASTAHAGPYIEVLGGFMPQNVNISATNDTTNEENEFIDENSDSDIFGTRVGIELSKYFALEACYIDNGTAVIDPYPELNDPLNLRSTSIQFGVRGILPLSDEISLNAKGGWALWQSWDGDIPRDDSEEAEDSLEKGQNPYFGAGAEFSFHENVSFGIDYTYLLMSTSEELEGFNFTSHHNHTTHQMSASLKFKM